MKIFKYHYVFTRSKQPHKKGDKMKVRILNQKKEVKEEMTGLEESKLYNEKRKEGK